MDTTDGSNAPGLRARVYEIERRLAIAFGRPTWHSHGDPLDQLIMTVLSQHTSDINTSRAFSSLKRHFTRWQDVLEAPTADVAHAIRSGGLSNLKAPRIQRILSAILAETGEFSLDALQELSDEDARSWLLSLPGVGPKTAACVLLFSLGRAVMPVDTHVHRVSTRLGLVGTGVSAEAAHDILTELTGPNRDSIYSLHLNMIQLGRKTCRARRPGCATCMLSDLCPSATV
jgi:endonuclease-3